MLRVVSKPLLLPQEGVTFNQCFRTCGKQPLGRDALDLRRLPRDLQLAGLSPAELALAATRLARLQEVAPEGLLAAELAVAARGRAGEAPRPVLELASGAVLHHAAALATKLVLVVVVSGGVVGVESAHCLAPLADFSSDTTQTNETVTFTAH